jgi:hypothetical protein
MSTVEEIVEAIKELSPEKRDEVRRQLVSLWPLDSRDSARDAAKADRPSRLYWDDKSLSLSIKRVRPRRPPIQIKGKPISETVVEDRR